MNELICRFLPVLLVLMSGANAAGTEKSKETVLLSADPKGELPMASRTNEVQVEWFPALGEYVALYCHHYKCYLIRSKNLKQWGDPVLIPYQDGLKKAWPSPTSMRVEDGELAFNLIVIPEDKPSDERSVKMLWTRDADTFEASTPAPFATGESNAVHVGDGKYLHVARTRRRKLNRLTFTYDREAKRWSECRFLPVPTYYRCEQDLLAHEGTLSLSAPLGPGRRNGCIYVSRDKGTTWNEHHKVPEAVHFGYSSISILPDGGIGLAVERQADPKALRNIVYRKVPAYTASARRTEPSSFAVRTTAHQQTELEGLG